MVIRLGRNGRFLACSEYPAHKETRPLPGEEEPPLAGTGDPCPQCGEGALTGKRGRFGPFVGCSRYPDCTYIRKDGPPPPEQLPFEVICPRNGDGQLVARRARRTGSVFWGCSAYPKCDFTTSHEPLGAVHETDDGPVGRRGDGAICLRCGAAIEPPADDTWEGARLPGGPPDPAAIAPSKGRRGRTGTSPRTARSRPVGARSGGRSGSSAARREGAQET